MVKGTTRNIETDKRFVDEAKVSDHYALCLTEEEVNPVTLSKGEQQIYDLIAKSVIAAHYPDFVYDSSEMIFTINGRFTFKSKGRVITDYGWKNVYRDIAENTSDDLESDLPQLEEGEIGQVQSIELKEGATSPPSRFTEGDLIKVMSNAAYYVKDKEDFQNKELSLGTEATRAGIITTIKKRYILVDKNKVYLQPEGRLLIEALGQGHFLTSALMTGNMERHLAELKQGVGDLNDFIKRTEKLTRMIIEKLKKDAETWNFEKYTTEIKEAELVGNCKVCGEPVIDKGSFYGCTAYEKTKCAFKINKKIKGKTLSKDNVVKILEKGHTQLIKGFKVKGKDKTFDAYLVWNENEKVLKFQFNNQ